MAEFKLSRFKYTWKGQWASYSRYNPDDVVSFGGKVYTCLETHDSDANFYNDLDYYNGDVPPLLVPKWELTADGTSWLGDWTNDVYYKVGDIVKLGGSTYVCIEAHTSRFPELVGDANEVGFELDVAKWTLQVSSTNWKIDWQLETYYKVNDIVRYGGRVYRCNTSHESSAVSNEGLEANLAYWDVVVIADDWKGNWTVNTRYKVNDIVKFGGNVYKCNVKHKSAITNELGLDADVGKWQLLNEGVEFVGTWAPSTTYKINDVVKYGGYLYKVNTFHDSETTFITSRYDIYCPGTEYDVIWDTVTVYQPGDIVQHGGNLFISLTKHTNEEPSTSIFNWEVLYQGSMMRGDWNITAEYNIGDVVRRGGNVYSCILDNMGQDPDFLNDGSTTDSTYWDLLIPGVHWRGVWVLGATYMAGDTVVWISSSYKCLDKHVADNGNRPDDDGADSSLKGRYWEKITNGNKINRLKNIGDLRTFGDTGDGSTIGYKALEVGEEGRALTVASDFEARWELLQNTENVFYVSQTGVDIPTAGTSPQNPWRTLRYATEQVPSNSTIFVKTGDYYEILPIKIPAYVAVVGDEIRSTTIRPAVNVFSADYITLLMGLCDHLDPLVSRVIQEQIVGDEILGYPDVPLYGTVPQDFSGSASTNSIAISLSTLIQIFKNALETTSTTGVSSTYPASISAPNIDANAQLTNNLEFIKNEIVLYLEETYPTLMPLPASWDHDIEKLIAALAYDILYPGNYKTIETAKYFINGANPDINKRSDMFYMQDGTGLRNMTLIGLEGTLGDLSILGTRRPNAGSFVSLDPGWGPADTSVWVGTRSPYVQNVTTFGTGCVGCKIDGDIHSGGNQTIVANDFTQVLSDGIGVWANGTGRTELVSVFTYYNHIGYLSTNGGKIRGTNGNCSYGTFGAVSEGYNTAETPITAVVNNRYYPADIHQAVVHESGIQKLFFNNAGEAYTTATYTVSGSGINASLEADEFRDGGVFEIRIANPGDSSTEGGSNYLFATNSGQGGTDQYIQLAGSDEALATAYRNMRLVIQSGTGTGQYGYIAEFDETGKYAYIAKESKTSVTVSATSSTGMLLTVGSTSHLSINDPVIFTGTKFGNIADNTVYYVRTIPNGTQITISATSGPGSVFGLINGTGSMTMHCIGWEHFVEGTPILTVLDSTSNYFIEPRVTFSSPGFTTTSSTLPNNRQWSSIAANDSTIIAVALDTASTAYSLDDGSSWSSGSMPTSALWTKVKYVGGVFMAFAANGSAAKSTDGISWSSMTMSSVTEWRDVTYGEGKWVAVAAGGTKAAYSTDGTTWTAATLPEGADWNAVVYGKGKFVTTALSDSSISGAATAYSDNGIDWTLGNLTQGSYSLAYGNGRFVALSGGYSGATEVAISFDGITWTEYTIQAQDWRGLKYDQGIFFAVASGTTTCAISRDGIVWTYQSLGSSSPWCDIAYSSINKPGKFIALSGLTANSTTVRVVATGATARARAYVVSGKMSVIAIWEPGSGYTSAPVMTITDPNNSTDVYTIVRIGNGVLGNPSVITAGTGYETTSTRVTLTGDGYKDQYQLGSELMVTNMTRIPGPGDNVNIFGINDYTYKLLTAEILSGTTGNYTARLLVAKDIGREESPEHGTAVSIRQLYSQVRLTGHDFLDMGLGNILQTNYPDTLNPIETVLAPEDEIKESNGGRVFYTSTDQDGNFRVGELFAVEQATGTVTLNAQFFQLEGLEEIRLGGINVGGSGTVIREFSTDTTFIADSNNIIPTQRAIKAYMTARVSGGGADAITGQLTAGVVRVGPDSISTTTGDELIITARVNFRGGVDGDLLTLNYFTSGGSI